MKNRIQTILLTLLTAFPLLGHAQQDLQSNPAYLPIDTAFDFEKVTPMVNVNLPRFLIQNVISEFDGGPDDPFAEYDIDFKDLVKGIELIRVIVIEPDDEDRAQVTAGYETLNKQLKSTWISIVSVPEENVGIYAISNASGDSMAGIAVLINEGDSVIAVNLVGEVSIGKIITIATKMKGLPPQVMEMLGGLNSAGTDGSSQEEQE